MSDEENGFDRLRVGVLALGHMVTDCYSNMIPSLLPLLKPAYDLSYTTSGLIMTVFTITSSVIQPLFGYYADKYGKRWLVALSVAWTAVFMSLIGAVWMLGIKGAEGYAIILALVALAGFGSASYHPQASTMVPRVSGDHKGFGVSVFSAGGNLGYAIMPLLVIFVTGIWGLGGTIILMIPGLLMSLLLQKYAPAAPSDGAHLRLKDLVADIRQVIKPLTTVILVVCMRAWLFFGLITFLPLYLATKGTLSEWSGLYIFILLLFGAIGSLIGGQASDKYGRKFVIIASLAMTGPLLLLSMYTEGILSLALVAAAGMALLASFSPAVLIAQGLIPRNQGMASGIILGFAIGVGGLGVSFTGAIADMYGIDMGVMSLIALPVIGLLIAFALPGAVAPHIVRRHA